MTDRNDVEVVVSEYFACLNEDRLEDAAALFAADAVFTAPGAKPRRGPQAIAELLSKAFAPWVEHRDEPVRWIVADAAAVVEISFTGRLHSGRQVSFPVLDVFDVSDGRIASLTSWNDSAYVQSLLSAP